MGYDDSLKLQLFQVPWENPHVLPNRFSHGDRRGKDDNPPGGLEVLIPHRPQQAAPKGQQDTWELERYDEVGCCGCWPPVVDPFTNLESNYCWGLKSCTTWYLGCMKPCKKWDKLPTSTGYSSRISSINSMNESIVVIQTITVNVFFFKNQKRATNEENFEALTPLDWSRVPFGLGDKSWRTSWMRMFFL